jgi:glycosyltransferase involved in cell wall biosynthesis
MPKYAIVSPVRDEEEFIDKTFTSVINQTIRPTEWIIVDDGSRDGTRSIIDKYAERHLWVVAVHRADRGQRIPGTGVMEAFFDGYERLQSPDWDFLVKLDGDVVLPPDYFQRCFQRFHEDPTLGICGGRMYCTSGGRLAMEPHPAFHVRGPIKLYRRACWFDIGGLIKGPGWDTVDEIRANLLGWKTRTFSDLAVIHCRPTGNVQGFWRDSVKMGRCDYVSRYHPAFMIVKLLKRIWKWPYLLCALAHGYGFLSGYFRKLPRVDDPAFIRYIRKQQIRRLFFLDSIWK